MSLSSINGAGVQTLVSLGVNIQGANISFDSMKNKNYPFLRFNIYPFEQVNLWKEFLEFFQNTRLNVVKFLTWSKL